MKQILTVLGATGSIGVNTLDLVARYPDEYEVYALTGFNQVDKLSAQCLVFKPKFAVVANAANALQLQRILKASGSLTEVLHGADALIDVATAAEVNTVIAAIVGAAGLPPTYAAAKKGKRILLANKETLVVAGALFMNVAKQNHAQILPVDSEHNAIFQVLPAGFDGNLSRSGIESIILTASGGPFLNLPLADFEHVTPEQAVTHPNWKMGKKISVDSASMMNKGLEVIEAHWLFGANVDQIEVVIHPQSVIHSMVRYVDGSILAQLGTPDMRTPIANCLAHPKRINAGVAKLDFQKLTGLTFVQPDMNRFKCLNLAFEALRQGDDAPCVLNAANEVAVELFLNEQIKFTQIASLIEYCLGKADLRASHDIDDLMEKDKCTRQLAHYWVKEHNVH